MKKENREQQKKNAIKKTGGYVPRKDLCTEKDNRNENEKKCDGAVLYKPGKEDRQACHNPRGAIKTIEL